MSSGFSLRFMSFLQNYPTLLVRGLRRLFMSARSYRNLFVTVTVRTARCRAAHPDRQHIVVAVNVDALVGLTPALYCQR